MRHKIAGNKLGRNSSLRKATVRDIAKATLIAQRICTTKAKAREARKLVDKLITMGKKGTLADKRRAFAILCDHKIVSNLFKNTAPRFTNRVGGYTRIIPIGLRRGDNAQLAYLELTEKTEIIISKPKSAASSKKEDLKPETAPSDETDQTPATPKKEKKSNVKTYDEKAAQKDKGKSGKKIVSGIRKMFNRKSPEQ